MDNNQNNSDELLRVETTFSGKLNVLQLFFSTEDIVDFDKLKKEIHKALEQYHKWENKK